MVLFCPTRLPRNYLEFCRSLLSLDSDLQCGLGQLVHVTSVSQVAHILKKKSMHIQWDCLAICVYTAYCELEALNVICCSYYYINSRVLRVMLVLVLSIAETIFGLDFFQTIYMHLQSCIINSHLKFSTALDISFHRELQQKRNLEYIACHSSIVIVVLHTGELATGSSAGLYKAGRC